MRMCTDLSPIDMQQVKDEAHKEMKEALDELQSNFPKVVDAAAVAVGGALGGAASFTALYFGGVVGLSAAGLSSGLAVAGALVGGGMAAGVSVLAAPVAIFGVAGYAIAKKRRNTRLAAALGSAIGKLCKIQERLIANAEHFREELAEIRAYIDQLTRQMP